MKLLTIYYYWQRIMDLILITLILLLNGTLMFPYAKYCVQ